MVNALVAGQSAGERGRFVGLDVVALGRLAAAGLVLYFAGAVIAHLRVKDRVAVFAPTAFVLVVAVAAFVLQIQR